MSNQKGVALLMILTTITILSALLVDFTFETNINKLKVDNIHHRMQARLNAESGLNLAIARLKLYKEAFNLLQKNKEMKGMIRIEDLNQIWSIPFMFPIPKMKGMNIIQKTALDEFEKNSLIQGKLNILIQNASNLINLNLLRISHFKKENQKKTTDPDEDNSSSQESGSAEDDFSIEKQLVKMLAETFERKKEEDEEFNDLYANVEPVRLIAAIKHYVSDKESYEDEYVQDFVAAYDSRGINPKHAPMSSLSEILLIEGWNQELLSLISNEVTSHGVVLIDLNQITEKTLKILIPNMEEDQVKDFFTYRDDPEDPHFFNSLKDFKRYIVNTSAIMEESAFDDIVKKYKKAGLKFGASGSLFRVIATGEFGRASYTITAYISLPAKPLKKEKKKKKTDTEDQKDPDDPNNETDPDDPNKKVTEKTPKKKKKQPLLLLNPRTVEITIN